MSRILELKEKRANLVHQAREMLDKVEAEKRSMTAEENTIYERIDADIDETTKMTEREEKLQNEQRKLGEKEAEKVEAPEEPKVDWTKLSARERRNTDEYRAAYNNWLLEGAAGVTQQELRAMQADSDTGGGYLVTPQQTVMQLIKDVDDLVVMRQLSRTFQLTQAKSLGVPTLATDADEADWTAELKTGNETEVAFGKRELRPHPIAKRVKISNTLLRLAAMSPEAIVQERLAYKFAVTQEKAFMTGDGVVKPLGIFTASNDGIPTGQDVSTGNTATSIQADGLIEAKYAMKQQYWPRARWIFHRDAVKQIRKLKDGNGQYLWQPGISAGAGDTIIGQPYTASEYAPNTFSTGKYVGILADFQYYWIADALDMQLQRLVELYAETNQTGYIARMELDAMPILAEAFVRVKLA